MLSYGSLLWLRTNTCSIHDMSFLKILQITQITEKKDPWNGLNVIYNLPSAELLMLRIDKMLTYIPPLGAIMLPESRDFPSLWKWSSNWEMWHYMWHKINHVCHGSGWCPKQNLLIDQRFRLNFLHHGCVYTDQLIGLYMVSRKVFLLLINFSCLAVL